MKFSVWPSSERSWDETLTRARHVELKGWFGLWYADHLMPNSPDGEPLDGVTHECWSVLAALASTTTAIRLGSLVSPVTLHHPVVLAKRASTVDHISGGRAVLGLGAGWQINEHKAAGIELPAPGERVRRFEEAIEIIHGMFGEGRVTTAGTWFRATDLPSIPESQRPSGRRLPIMVGTASPRMGKITARWADEWNVWGDVETVTAKTAVFDAACESVGRDPSAVWRSSQALWVLTDEPAKAATMRERLPSDRSLIGSAAELVDAVGRFAALGVDELIIPDFTLGATAERRAEAYDRIWSEVLTQV